MNQQPVPPAQEFLYRIRPSRPEMLTEGPTDVESASIERHFAYLKNLTEQGVVRLAGRTLHTDPTSFGIVVFRAASEMAARQIMEDDPAVKDGVMLAELFPFRIALWAKEADAPKGT
jgi:uncharacterized protein YciI